MSIQCKLCSSDDTEPLFTAQNTHGRHVLGQQHFKVHQCSSCGVAFLEVDINKEYYKNYYYKNYYDDTINNWLVSGAIKLLGKISFSRRLKLIEKYKPPGNRVLEIGCANGKFLNQLPSYFDKSGNEINEEGHSYIQKHFKNIKLYSEKMDRQDLKGFGTKFDIILMWHVLEHIENPKELLKNLSQLLNEKGVFIFEVPNRDSMGFCLTRKEWFFMDAPRHLFHYNRRSLQSVLKSFDFEIIGCFGNAFDYFHDLSFSLCKRFRTKIPIINMLVAFVVFPVGLVVRALLSLFYAPWAELNTYIVKRV